MIEISITSVFFLVNHLSGLLAEGDARRFSLSYYYNIFSLLGIKFYQIILFRR